MINMEVNYLNDIVALNENLKIKKSEIHIKHNNIEKEISKVQQKIKTNKISLNVRMEEENYLKVNLQKMRKEFEQKEETL